MVPSGPSIIKGEGHAIKGTVFQSDLIGGHLEPDPMADWWKRSNVIPAGRTVHAVNGNVISSPISAMLPGTIIPLEHHLGGRIVRVQIDIGNKDIACAYVERAGRGCEVVLVQPGTDGGLIG